MAGDRDPLDPREPRSRETEAAFAASKADRDRTLETVHVLESTVGMAAPGREKEWLQQVGSALGSLEDAVATERAESLRPDSLLSLIGQDYPRRFGSRVRQLREQQDDIGRQIASLRNQIDEVERDVDFSDIRQRLSWLVRAIHHRRARESDLVFEAISLDLGAE